MRLIEKLIHRTFRPEGLKSAPDLFILRPLPGTLPSIKPPVRIFVGSEPGQRRAERMLIWSIIRHRDPCRTYEIHIMRDLAGFRRTGWVTGFTNYRYAIPHYAGYAGRAIYNDANQVYLADPALLFDLPMGGAGFLVAANRPRNLWAFDTSVALIDCARMSSVWTLHTAQSLPPEQILDLTAAVPELQGALPPEWNARDREYVPDRSKLLHYTRLRTQPWRPFPRQFRYEAQPESTVFFALEREADAARFLWPNIGAEGQDPAWPVRLQRLSAANPTFATALLDLMEYRPWVYFADVTISLGVGYFACWKYFTVEDGTVDQFLWFLVAGLALFRGMVFVNEVARLPKGRMTAFKAYWNLVCGIPLLSPSFMFEPTRPSDPSEAEKRAAAGLNSPVGPAEPRAAMPVTLQILKLLAAPILVTLRFLVLGPLLMLVPKLKEPLLKRLSAWFPALARDHDLTPTVGGKRIAAEICCFLVVLFVVFAYADDVIPWSTFAEVYILCVFAVALRAVVNLFTARKPARSLLAAPVTVLGPPVLDSLLLPAGWRYQALRKQVPTVPYHNLGRAHRRLMATLPSESAYKQRVLNVGQAVQLMVAPTDTTAVDEALAVAFDFLHTRDGDGFQADAGFHAHAIDAAVKLLLENEPGMASAPELRREAEQRFDTAYYTWLHRQGVKEHQ